MSATSPQHRLEQARDDLESVREDVNHGAALVAVLAEQHDRLAHGDVDDDEVGMALARLEEAVERLQRHRFDAIVAQMDATLPPADALDEMLDALADALQQDDRDEYDAALADLAAAFRPLLDALSRGERSESARAEWREVREGFETAFVERDDELFERAAQDARALHGDLADAAFERRVGYLRSLLGRLDGSPTDVLDDLVAARDEGDREAFDERLGDLSSLLDETNEELRDARLERLDEAFERGDAATAGDAVAALRADVAAGRDRLAELRADLDEAKRAVVAGLPEDASVEHPKLDDGAQPTLLLPVRLETRFADDRLQVRVYPDQVHVDAHERGLTRREAEDGDRFWRDVWWAALDVATSNLRGAVEDQRTLDALADADLSALPEEPDARLAAVKERAWSRLVERYGRERAAWVKEAVATAADDDLEPLLLEPVKPRDAPTLPDPVPEGLALRPESWTRPPTAELLPDRWVAFATFDADADPVTEYAPNPVREPLRVGPDPGAGSVDAGAPEWMVDFDAALDAGMALEVPYPAGAAPESVTVEELVVVGVKSTATPGESSEAFQGLLDAHRYTDGLEFLEQGTPTNNAADRSSSYSSSPDPAESVDVECGSPLVGPGSPDHEGERDGAKAARLLGLDAGAFGRVAGADGVEQLDAFHANRALWCATWGSFVPHMLAPDRWVGERDFTEREAVMEWLAAYREHFADYVRARGPLPALRVGEQPYGVLPATTLDGSEWTPDAFSTFDAGDDPVALENLPAHLTRLVRALRDPWERSLPGVPHVSEADTGVGEELLDLLSMEGTAFGYESRPLVGTQGWLHAAIERLDLDSLTEEEKDALVRFVEEVRFDPTEERAMADLDAALGGDSVYGPDSSGSFADVPRVARLIFMQDPTRRVQPLADTSVGEFVSALRNSPFDLLRFGPPGTSLTGDDERIDGDVDVPARHVYEDMGFAAGDGANSVLEALLYYATLQEYVLGRVRIHRKTGHFDDHILPEAWTLFPEREVYQFDHATPTETVLERVPSGLADDYNRVQSHDSYADVLDRAAEVDVAGGGTEIDRWFRTFAASLDYLVARDPDAETASLLLSETLDLATHRLDAWETSLATKRLDDVRRTRAARGVYVGACGWVTDLSMREGDASDGYVQTPSLPQATTAAVLRSGHLSHEGARRDALAVDLSSERVRLATDLIEGVRADQPLGALLGYRFERALHEHDRDLDRYVRAFRTLDPIEAGKMGREETPSEAIAARDVVDGLALYRRLTGKRAAIPWGESVPGSASGVTLPSDATDADGNHDPDYVAIRGALDEVERAVDAVRDLLTAESVHQLVNGRPMKAGGSLDALSRGEAPPDLDVTRTPRSGVANTHRVLVLFDETTPYASAWPLDPGWHLRGVAEPNLHAWAGAMLPDPERVVCLAEFDLPEDAAETPPDPAVVHLADLDVSPLDVLFVPEGDEDAQASELESRVRYHLVRERDAPADATVELTFAPVSEWEYSAADLGHTLDGRVSFGELLEVARRLREVVSGGRAASPADVQPAVSATDDGVRADELRARADPAVATLRALDAGLDETLAVLEPDDEGASEADRFAAVCDALLAYEDRVDLPAVVGSLTDLDPDDIYGATEQLHQRLADGATVLETDADGRVPLVAGGDALHGTTSEPTETVAVRVRGQDEPWLEAAEVEMRDGGAFTAHLGVAEVPPGTAATVEVRGDDGSVLVTYEAVVVEEPGERSLRLVDDGPLAAFLDARARRRRAFDAAGEVEERVAALDAAAVEATRHRAETGDFWTGDWAGPWSQVGDVLALARPGFPGFDGGMPAAWDRLAAAVDPLAADDEPPGLRPITERLGDYLGDVSRNDVEAALAAATGSVDALADAVPAASAAGGALRAGATEALRDLLYRASYLGVYGSVPQSATGWSDDDVAALVGQARGVRATVRDRVADLPDGAAADDPGDQHDRLAAVFGESFLVCPPFRPGNADELAAALHPDHSRSLQNDDPMQVETWFHRAARMRDQPGALQTAFTYANAVDAGGPTADHRLRVAQLPYRGESDTWVGLDDAWDDDRPGGRLSMVVHDGTTLLDGDGTAPATSAPDHPWIDDGDPFGRLADVFGGDAGRRWAGLFVDEWVETVPSEEETTGVAVHYDQPNSRPPQSMLLAAPPNDPDDGNDPNASGWSLEKLERVVSETRRMARRRVVDTESLTDLGQFLPAVTVGHNSDDGPRGPDAPTFDFDALTEDD